MSIDLAIAIAAIVIGAMGSVASALSMYFVNKMRNAKNAEIEQQRLELQQQKQDHREHDSIFGEYRIMVETSQSLHSFLRDEIINLKKDIDELQNDRRNCRKENDELRARVLQLEEELASIKRRLPDGGVLSIVTSENAA
jgi:chromosome segregation ATPase